MTTILWCVGGVLVALFSALPPWASNPIGASEPN